MSSNRKDVSSQQGKWSQAGSTKRVRLAHLTVNHLEGPTCSCHFFVASPRLSFLSFDVSSHDSLKHVKVPGLVKSSTHPLPVPIPSPGLSQCLHFLYVPHRHPFDASSAQLTSPQRWWQWGVIGSKVTVWSSVCVRAQATDGRAAWWPKAQHELISPWLDSLYLRVWASFTSGDSCDEDERDMLQKRYEKMASVRPGDFKQVN